MKAKLFKKVDGEYYLLLNTPKEYPYELQPLSKKNCDEIFEVVDVERLAYDYSWTVQSVPQYGTTMPAYKEGFNKAMELNKDKVFTLEDMKRAIFNFANYDYQNMSELEGRDKAIQSLLQPIEIEVEIVMDAIPADRAPGGWDKFPKLDSEGCLILRRA